MQITFNTPYGFSSDSTPEENRRANQILRETLSKLNKGPRGGASASMSRTGRCLFTYDLPALFCASSTPVQDGAALQVLLDGLIALNEAFLSTHAVRSLYTCGVVYGRTEIWDTIPALYARRYGDCKSVSAALIAEYRKQGIDCLPVFRWVKTPDMTKDYHILVLTGTGFEDPSKVLGMGRNENAPM